MKYSLVLFIGFCLTFTTVDGSAVSCSVIDYLYYSSDCCDSSNTVQCMESIPQTDKAAIDNLASLKRPDGAACQSGDNIKFFNSKIVCADDDTCIIPCVNGNISGTVGTACTCTCETGFQGADCSTATPCTVCQNGGVLDPTGSVADGTCSCDCSGTNGHTGTLCEIAPAIDTSTFTAETVGNLQFTAPARRLSEAECQAYATDNSYTYTTLNTGVPNGGVRACSLDTTTTPNTVNFDDRTDFADGSGCSANYACVVKP